MTVPEWVRTPRQLLRPWRADDAAALRSVLEANQTHLAGWIPRHVSEPAPVPELAARLAGFAAAFAAEQEWRYGLFTPDGSAVLGEVSLFPRNEAGRVPFVSADRVEIGYWLRVDRTGQGLATEAAEAVLAIAGTLPSLEHAEIRCDARNGPSNAVPRRLGFVLAASEAQPGVAAGDSAIILQVWRRPLGPLRAASDHHR